MQEILNRVFREYEVRIIFCSNLWSLYLQLCLTFSQRYLLTLFFAPRINVYIFLFPCVWCFFVPFHFQRMYPNFQMPQGQAPNQTLYTVLTLLVGFTRHEERGLRLSSGPSTGIYDDGVYRVSTSRGDSFTFSDNRPSTLNHHTLMILCISMYSVRSLTPGGWVHHNVVYLVFKFSNLQSFNLMTSCVILFSCILNYIYRLRRRDSQG